MAKPRVVAMSKVLGMPYGQEVKGANPGKYCGCEWNAPHKNDCPYVALIEYWSKLPSE